MKLKPKTRIVTPGNQILSGHPLALGLHRAFVFNRFRKGPELITNTFSTIAGASSNFLRIVIRPNGLALSAIGDQAEIDFKHALVPTTTSPFTVVQFFFAENPTSMVFSSFTADFSARFFSFDNPSTGVINALIRDSTDSFWATLNLGTSISAGESHMAGCTWSNGKAKGYWDGRLVSVDTSVTAHPQSAAPPSDGVIGSRFGAVRQSTYCFYAWKRMLSDEEMMTLYLNPYAFIQPQGNQLEYMSAGKVNAVIPSSQFCVSELPVILQGLDYSIFT